MEARVGARCGGLWLWADVLARREIVGVLHGICFFKQCVPLNLGAKSGAVRPNINGHGTAGGGEVGPAAGGVHGGWRALGQARET